MYRGPRRRTIGFSADSALPGKLDDGSVLLPNGWRIAPAGKHLGVGTLPLNIVVTQDGRYAIVVTSGLMRPALAVIDVATWTVKNTYQLDNAWYGLTLSPDGTKVYVGGGGQNNVQEFSYADGVSDEGADARASGPDRPDVRWGACHQSRRQDAVCDACVRDDAVGH